ncbi:MAG: hypothetical protein HY557_06650 [Euryarchaeota archaeon]|nr:hypothetical protein [Euryarchaeota archaeon]
MGDARLVLLPAIRGLVSEGERVRRAIEEVQPEAVGLTVGREDLAALESYDGSEHPPANWEEELYVAGLSQWGDVRKPPPCFVEAVRLAKERGLILRALDFNDEDYTEKYVELVTAWDLLGHTRLHKKAGKHRWEATTPEEFVLEFDRFVSEPEGYVALERAREGHIAQRLAKLARKHRSLLAVVEYERATAVWEILRSVLQDDPRDQRSM